MGKDPAGVRNVPDDLIAHCQIDPADYRYWLVLRGWTEVVIQMQLCPENSHVRPYTPHDLETAQRMKSP